MQDYRSESRVFEEFATLVPQSVNLTGGEEPERVLGGFVSSTFFKIFGAQTAEGRVFLPEEDAAGAERASLRLIDSARDDIEHVLASRRKAYD